MRVRKTNAMRLLDAAGVRYEVVPYPFDESDLSAETVARRLGLPESAVFKTLVAVGDVTGPVFAVVPAGRTLDAKALATLSGNKRIEMAPLRDVRKLTGYVRGAVTVPGARKAFPVFADETLRGPARISVSAGQRGLQVLLAPADYLRVTAAATGAIARAGPRR